MKTRRAFGILIGCLILVGIGSVLIRRSPIPTYPTIKGHWSDPDPQSTALAYFSTPDSRETIMEFYRATMPRYGWVEQPAGLPQFMYFVQQTDSQSIMIVLIEEYGQFRTVKVGPRVRMASLPSQN